MSKIIVSYDGTDNDRDALALGRLFRDTGAEVSLAYVRHTQQPDRAREALEEKEAEQLLKGGADELGDSKIAQHVVVHASTGDGLWELAEEEGADVVVFGSDYRTAEGHVIPGTSAHRLLTGGPTAVAVAPAGFRNQSAEIKSIRVVGEDDADEAAEQTAQALAKAFGAEVSQSRDSGVDMLIVGSSPASPKGHVNLSARAGYAIETANSPVLAVPRGAAVELGKPSLAQRALSRG
jgi:nucleotide-binding universal stress UspA family protein